MLSLEELYECWEADQAGVVRSKIAQFLKQERHRLPACLHIAEFYLSIYDFHAAARLIDLQKLLNSRRALDKDIEAKGLIFAARALNALGASTFAFDLMGRTEARFLKPYQKYVAGILTVNRRFKEAIPLYKTLLNQEPIPSRDHSALYLTRCYAGSFQFERALETISDYEDLVHRTDPNSIVAVYTITGETYLLAQRPAKAKKYLEKALRIYDEIPLSGNRAYAELWLGGCYALEGRYDRARQLFLKAREQLYKKGIHPETCLQVDYWLGLSEFLHLKTFPLPWLRLAAFPGSWAGSQSEFAFTRWIQEWADIPSHAVLRPPLSVRNSEVFRLSSRSPLTERLLYYLLLAADFGLPKHRLFELLWPDEIYSLAQMDKRLEQLAVQLRKKGIHVESSEGQYFCKDRRFSVEWSTEQKTEASDFLKTHPIFKRSDLESYLNVRKSKAAEICQTMVKEGKISRRRKGRNCFYVRKAGPSAK